MSHSLKQDKTHFRDRENKSQIEDLVGWLVITCRKHSKSLELANRGVGNYYSGANGSM